MKAINPVGAWRWCRAAWLVGALTGAWAGAQARPHVHHAHAASAPTAAMAMDARRVDPAMMARRADLLAQAEQALAAGDAAGAERLFDRAAALLHAADTELGLVRTYLQMGDYRRGVNFAAHTAGAHAEDISGAALYAWLLHLGGQTMAALGVLDKAQASVGQHSPGQAVVTLTRERLMAAMPVAPARLMQPPLRLAPAAHGQAVPTPAQVVATGVLLADGRHALIPAGSLPQGQQALWLRDGLGQTVQAVPAQPWPELGLVLVALTQPLPGRDQPGLADVWRVPTRDPFPGAPGLALAHAETPGGEAAWPLMKVGFMGMPKGPAGWRDLGMAVAAPHLGGPVLDAAGRLVGISARSAQGDALMVPMSLLRARLGGLGDLGDGLGTESPQSAQARLPLDLVYERSLRLTLQVLVPQEAPLLPSPPTPPAKLGP